VFLLVKRGEYERRAPCSTQPSGPTPATSSRTSRTATGHGDTDATARFLNRILAKDPYDEQCHRDLIDTLTTAGRHGEAQRAQVRYAEAIRSIGLPTAYTA
jgi:hypothetical protein